MGHLAHDWPVVEGVNRLITPDKVRRRSQMLGGRRATSLLTSILSGYMRPPDALFPASSRCTFTKIGQAVMCF